MPHALSKGGCRPDLQAPAGLADSAQFLDLAQVDHDFRPLDAILQPIEGVQTAGHHPSIFTVLAEQPHRVVDRRRLKEFERWHHIAYHGHICVLLRSLRWSLLHRAYGARLKCALSAALASGGPLRAPRESRP